MIMAGEFYRNFCSVHRYILVMTHKISASARYATSWIFENQYFPLIVLHRSRAPQVRRSGFARGLNSMLKRLFDLLVGKRRG